MHVRERPPVIGFELDMVLNDPRPAIRAALGATADQTGAAIDVKRIMKNLQSPIPPQLSEYYLSESSYRAGLEVFRWQLDVCSAQFPAVMPSAAQALAAVVAAEGRSIVLTSRGTSVAKGVLEATGLKADDVRGEVWTGGKPSALNHFRAWAYVGYREKDMFDVSAAGLTAVGVVTEMRSADILRCAGADVVLNSLEEFPSILADLVPPVAVEA